MTDYNYPREKITNLIKFGLLLPDDLSFVNERLILKIGDRINDVPITKIWVSRPIPGKQDEYYDSYPSSINQHKIIMKLVMK